MTQGTEAATRVRQLALAKGEHRFVFRYVPGKEAALIHSFAELASRSDSNFDWFDAAFLSYQLGRRLETELNKDA